MKTFRFVMAIVLVCVAGVARADVVAGNLLTNSDFNTNLDGWLQAGGGPGSVAWTDAAKGTNAADPVGGGMLMIGSWEVQNVGANAFTFAADTTYYVSFVAGSLDHSAPTDPLVVRLGQAALPWTVADPTYYITHEQLNAGLAEFDNLAFTPVAGIIGTAAQVWLDTYATATDANHLVIDRLVLTTSPIVAGALYQPVPEPGTLILMVTGLIGLLCYAWRKRK
jgi:hypothetical protein